MKSSSYPKASSLSLSSGVNEHTITSINIAVYRLANQKRWKLYRESNPAAYTAESFTHCKKTGKHYLSPMDIRRHLRKLLWVIWFNNLSSVTPCGYQRTWPFPSQQLGINSSENLVLNQTISLLDYLVIFITRLPSSVLILQEEIISLSFLRVKGLSKDMFESRTVTKRRMELRHQQISWNVITVFKLQRKGLWIWRKG